ncbi:MAG: acyl-CoA dehydrogenase [Aeromicrobium sp.]|nr:acyl-CoA dehydrogenase [Aeromicrobium sp.]
MIDPPDLTATWRTPERESLVEGAREFAGRLRPLADELDRTQSDLPADVIAEMGRRGYFGVLVSRDHGGLGHGVLEYCLVSEELSRAWLSAGSIIARGQGFGTGVADATRRAELLSLSPTGRWIGAAAFSEPEAGSDLAAITTTATVDGDDLVLSGHKRWWATRWARTSSSSCAAWSTALGPNVGPSAPCSWRRSRGRCRWASPPPRSTRSAITA